MKRELIFTMAVSIMLVLFSGCRMVDDSAPLFWASLEIALGEKYSDNVTVTSNAGVVQEIESDRESSSIKFNINDHDSTSGEDIRAHEYIITFTGANIESGTYIRVVTDDAWSEIDKIYDKDGNEIPFEQGPSVNDYSFTLP